VEAELPALEEQATAVGLVDAGEDLHQRRLARAVLPDQRVRLARVQLDRAVLKGQHRPERLAGMLEHQARPPGQVGRWRHVVIIALGHEASSTGHPGGI
jgi:hypothetical protein